MADRITYGVGAHEPIWHRLRTGNTTADEWARWEYETSRENLERLRELGVTHAHIACCKGFGLEQEKPLIERAARFAADAARFGIATDIYIQGYPVYYESFLAEVPEAEGWLARRQDGDFIPWGGQTFRRWMDPTRPEFQEYELRLFDYVLSRFRAHGVMPSHAMLDNTVPPPFWSASARLSFREHLRRTWAGTDLVREFGIPSFDCVDLPHFDPVYFPADAMRIVKDPLLQEWARWRSRVCCSFVAQVRDLIHAQAPGMTLHTSMGCESLRYNTLFIHGVDFEERLAACDHPGMEESGWRPGVNGDAGSIQVIMDERHPDAVPEREQGVRVATDSRWPKIAQNYGRPTGGGFWGEFDRESKLVALAHGFTFAQHASHLGSLGPLAAPRQLKDDIADVIAWGDRHISVLAGRENRVAPIAVWRSTASLGFIRHRPVLEACIVEQMLYENHLPFTILLDGGLERFLAGRRLLVLPGAACVSDAQVRLISDFVAGGGKLLLLGETGTRDERTRLRRTHAFAHLFGTAMPDLERIGPPHWVPELDFGRVPATLRARHGQGEVALVRRIALVREPDLTRDPYMPERQVMTKDVLPPANEAEIMTLIDDLLGDGVVRAEAPRTTLVEYWKRGRDLVACFANLRKGRDGGPVTLRLGDLTAAHAEVHQLLVDEPVRVPVHDGAVRLDALPRFAAVVVPGVL